MADDRYARHIASSLKRLFAFELAWVNAELSLVAVINGSLACVERLTSTESHVLWQKQH